MVSFKILRRARTPAPTDEALLLLAALPSRFAAMARVSRNPLLAARRRIEVRANYLLVFHDKHALGLNTTLCARHLRHCIRLPAQSAVRLVANSLVLPSITLAFTTRIAARRLHLLLPPPSPTAATVGEPPIDDGAVSIGRGATCVVHAVDRYTAVKCIPKATAFESATSVRSLVQEHAAHIALRDAPFTLRLRAAHEAHSHMALVYDLAHYGDLNRVLARLPHHKLPPSAARVLFAEMLVGLQAVHDTGRLYRDVKLPNVLLTQSGHVRLADFGLCTHGDMAASYCASPVSTPASRSSDEMSRQPRAAKSFVGTRRYMSPELCGAPHTRRAYGAPADVWALGVSLFVLLTGRYPFGATTGDNVGLMLCIRNDDVCIPEDLPHDAAHLLRGMLTRDALDRLDLSQVRHHPWLRDVDWSALVARNAADLPNHDIVALLRQHGVRGVREEAADAALTVSDVSVAPVAEQDALSDLPGYEKCTLLGFDYVG